MRKNLESLNRVKDGYITINGIKGFTLSYMGIERLSTKMMTQKPKPANAASFKVNNAFTLEIRSNTIMSIFTRNPDLKGLSDTDKDLLKEFLYDLEDSVGFLFYFYY